MDFTLWGNYHEIDERNYIVYKKSSKAEYHIELFNDYQIVNLKIEDNVLLTFKDVIDRTHREINLSSFTRTIKNHEYIFINGEILIKKVKKIVPFLTKINQNIHNNKNFITMDLETRVINEEMSAYCVSIYDGKIYKSFYLSDFSGEKAEKDMLKASINYLMKRKYNNYRVYLHNFSRFNSVFFSFYYFILF